MPVSCNTIKNSPPAPLFQARASTAIYTAHTAPPEPEHKRAIFSHHLRTKGTMPLLYTAVAFIRSFFSFLFFAHTAFLTTQLSLGGPARGDLKGFCFIPPPRPPPPRFMPRIFQSRISGSEKTPSLPHLADFHHIQYIYIFSRLSCFPRRNKTNTHQNASLSPGFTPRTLRQLVGPWNVTFFGVHGAQ